MLDRVFEKIELVVDHVWLNLLMAMVLMSTSLAEILADTEQFTVVGAHHGVFVFGLIHLLRSFSGLNKSYRKVQKQQTQGKDVLPDVLANQETAPS